MTRLLVTGGSGFIGTNLISMAEKQGYELMNFDVAPPMAPDQVAYWRPGDLCNEEDVRQALREFQPAAILNLAARTDTRDGDLAGYANNVMTVRVLLTAMSGTLQPDVRFVHTSTQYVLAPGEPADLPRRYRPHTAYGLSKAISEEVVRSSSKHPWVIVRPTNVWGPYHYRYARELWRHIAKGRYVLPRSTDPLRSYGYVGNVATQMLACLQPGGPTGQVLYVGDAPMRQSEWVTAFAMQLRGAPPPTVPLPALKALSLLGVALEAVGGPRTLDPQRLANMTADYVVPMQQTHDAVGRGPWDLQQGVSETVSWLSEQRWLAA